MASSCAWHDNLRSGQHASTSHGNPPLSVLKQNRCTEEDASGNIAEVAMRKSSPWQPMVGLHEHVAGYQGRWPLIDSSFALHTTHSLPHMIHSQLNVADALLPSSSLIS